jgi:flagellar protein FlaJ
MDVFKKIFDLGGKNLVYADLNIAPEKFITLSFLYSFSISILLFSLVFVGMSFGYLIAILCFFVIEFIINLIIVLIGDRRGSYAETVLPDALQLMSANIRSGLTPDKALLFAARPEFGVLEKQIKLAASKAVAGESIEESLLSLGNKIKSRIITRTFTLIVEGMKKGGEIASLLEQTADDIRDLKMLKKEVSAQVGMYTILIFIAIGFATPLLFAFSTHLVATMSAISSTIAVPQSASYTALGPLQLSIVHISSDFLKTYSLITLTFTAIFGSLLIGMLQEGKEKAGVKYIPILLTLDITIYFGARMLLSSLIGTLAPTSTLL